MDVLFNTDSAPDYGEFGGHPFGEAVQPLGPVERNGGYVVSHLEFNSGKVGLLDHRRSSVDPVDTGIFAPDSLTWLTWLAISRLRILPAGPSGNSRQYTKRRGCLYPANSVRHNAASSAVRASWSRTWDLAITAAT